MKIWFVLYVSCLLTMWLITMAKQHCSIELSLGLKFEKGCIFIKSSLHKTRQSIYFLQFFIVFSLNFLVVSIILVCQGRPYNIEHTAHTWNLSSEITSTNVEENTVSNHTTDH